MWIEDKEGDHVRRSRHDEQAHITPCELKNESGCRGYQHPSYGARHAAESHNRTHCFSRKHVRYRCEEVRRPSLMSCRRQANQQDCPPLRNSRCKHNRDDEQSTDQHHGFSSPIDAPAPADECSREPPPADAADARHGIDNDQRWAKVGQIEIVSLVEEFRQPVQIEPPDRVRQELPGDERPCRPEFQETEPGNLLRHRFDGIATDICQFCR